MLLVREGEKPQVVAKAQAGDRAAFNELVLMYRGRVMTWAYRLVSSRSLAEDVAQEVFARVYEGLARFRGESKFSTWLFRVTINCCRDILKSPRAFFEVADEPSVLNAASVADPEQTASESQRSKRLAEALKKLTPEYREAFLGRFLEDLSFDELAWATHQSVSSAKMRVHRAVIQLKGILEAK
ncbi:MAG: RNA polymerase sigma factor [Pseudomonadota bacterium]